MISRFTRLFKKTDYDESRAFQVRVLSILREVHGDRRFKATDDPLTIMLDEQILGLTNIRSNFLLGSQTDGELRELVVEHFSRVTAGLATEKRTEITWADASPLLRPQLMPEQYLEKLQLISRPFGGGIVLGFVVDAEETYSYVTEKDLQRWEVSDEVLHDLALENLKQASKGAEITLFPPPNPFVAINTLDGFDAARIVLPGIRKLLAEDLGFPFHFAVPNRDFLICWSAACEPEFVDGMRSRVSQDFDERPYPLSRDVFEVTGAGEISELGSRAPDRRIGQPEYN